MLLVALVIIGLIVLLAIASMTPFSLYVKGARGEEISYQAAFRWPWKAFGIGIRRDAQGRYLQLLCGDRCLYQREKRRKARKERREKKRKKSGLKLPRDRKLLSQLIKAGLRFLRDLLSCLRRPRLAGDMEIGFSDPAAMGIISGCLYAMSPTGTLGDLKIRPNYVDTALTGQVDFSAVARPARIIVVLIKLLFHLPIRGLLKLRKRRKEAAKDKEVTENGS